MQAAWGESHNEKVESFLSGVDRERTGFERETRAKAYDLFCRYWKKLSFILDSPPRVEDLFPVAPEIIIKHILEVDYFEPETIPAENYADVATGKSMTEIAGLIDRKNNRVIIANKFKPEWKRFTAAHELGHWMLHPNVVYLRERPLKRRFIPAGETNHGPLRPDSIRLRERPITGHELAYHKRPPDEREADLFASELLMPTRHLVKTFFQRFGGPIDGAEQNEEVAFWLSAGSKRVFDAIDFSKWKTRERSQLIAQVSSFRGNHFTPLVSRYGVSLTAMAIQLEDLGLVK